MGNLLNNSQKPRSKPSEEGKSMSAEELRAEADQIYQEAIEEAASIKASESSENSE